MTPTSIPLPASPLSEAPSHVPAAAELPIRHSEASGHGDHGAHLQNVDSKPTGSPDTTTDKQDAARTVGQYSQKQPEKEKERDVEECKQKSSALLPVNAGPYLTPEKALGEGYWVAEREQLDADQRAGKESGVGG
jgi:hypothetical protein